MGMGALTTMRVLMMIPMTRGNGGLGFATALESAFRIDSRSELGTFMFISAVLGGTLSTSTSWSCVLRFFIFCG